MAGEESESKDTSAAASSELEAARAEITRLKRGAETDRALASFADEVHALWREAPDAIFSFTPEGRYSRVNHALAVAFGRPAEEIVGKSLADFFPREEAERRFACLRHVFTTGEDSGSRSPRRS